MRAIHLLPLGSLPEGVSELAKSVLNERLGWPCAVLPMAPLPERAYVAKREQYDAGALLEFLFDRLAPEAMRIVGLTAVDLFAEGRNFVFGYAHLRDRVAIFSTIRFAEGATPLLLRERIEKALGHELGHTFQVPHCPETGCVMHQVEFLRQLDELPRGYCQDCAIKVRQAVARGVDSAEALFDLGSSCMRRRRFARAAACYEAAARLAPENAHYHNDHGVALLAMGDRRRAAQAFERAVELAPDTPHAYYNLGILSREHGKLAEADHFFAEAIRREDDLLSATKYLGILHHDYFGDRLRADSYFRRYRTLGGNDPEVLRRMGSSK